LASTRETLTRLSSKQSVRSIILQISRLAILIDFDEFNEIVHCNAARIQYRNIGAVYSLPGSTCPKTGTGERYFADK
jgi:hypothetical protein